jgi:hypothetical protein
MVQLKIHIGSQACEAHLSVIQSGGHLATVALVATLLDVEIIQNIRKFCKEHH